MRAVSSCFSALQGPKGRSLCILKENVFVQPMFVASIWSRNFHTFHALRNSVGKRFGLKLVVSDAYRASRDDPSTGRLKQRTVTTKTERTSNITRSSKSCVTRPSELGEETVTMGTKLNLYNSEVIETKDIKHYDVQPKVEGSKKSERLVTIFVFDTETTGLHRENERIIEFALRDLSGGKDSTLQTLVNPERDILNDHIHGITTSMVNRPDVPRFSDLIPILQHYVKTRQIPGTPILWVGHNARVFDVPFLISEFSRCSMEIPSDWLFLDTLSLARDLMKLEGSKLTGKSVQALREYYGIPWVGKAHTAMADVNMLSQILRHMTIDLQLPASALLERSFTASHIINAKKKKTTTS